MIFTHQCANNLNFITTNYKISTKEVTFSLKLDIFFMIPIARQVTVNTGVKKYILLN